MGKIQKTS